MTRKRQNALHLGQFAGITIYTSQELQDDVKGHFSQNNFPLNKVLCFSEKAPDKLSLVFDIVEKSREVAKTIMGLFNRNDIEIEMICSTLDNNQGVTRVKLRKADDIDKCMLLLDKCAAISISNKTKQECKEK
ncbi:hypothetical protein VDN48_000014 [Citrobacter braakii]|nr:hypothetical protein [Citrobacter braakii]